MKRQIVFIALMLLAGCASQHTADLGHPDRLALDANRRCMAAVSATSDINAFHYCDQLTNQ